MYYTAKARYRGLTARKLDFQGLNYKKPRAKT
jgi:hypothetical protein